MKQIVFALLFVLFSTPVVAQTTLPKELPNAVVMKAKDIQVKNPGGISILVRSHPAMGKTLKFDEKCSIEVGAVLVAIAEKDGKVLLKYSYVKRSTFLNECPNDTLLFVSIDEYKAMSSIRREGHTIGQELEMDDVARLLMISKR